MCSYDTGAVQPVLGYESDTTQWQGQKDDDTDLRGSKLLFIFLPSRFDTVARLGAIPGFLFRRFVRIVFLGCFGRIVVAEPVSILLQRRLIVEGMRVWRRTSVPIVRGVLPTAG